jgi:hypothetical protein
VQRPLVVAAIAAAAVLAAGCAGSTPAGSSPRRPPTPATRAVSPVVPPEPVARFEVSGVYPGADLRGGRAHERFGLVCGAKPAHRALPGRSWRGRLCRAILDYQGAAGNAHACFCAATSVSVDVRGAVHGRRVREQFTPCVCGESRRAIRDTHVILATHPPRAWALLDSPRGPNSRAGAEGGVR